MTREMKTRTQRRMEKKQALLLLLLMLAVSLVSFSLGVMVGKSGAPEQKAAVVEAPEPERIPVAKKAPGESAAPPPAEDQGAEGAAPPAQPEPLTFFDTLPKGEESPLGSGINTPPREKTAPAAAPEAPTDEEQEQAVRAPAPVVEAPARSALPAADTAGRFVVQVASFRGADDARNLEERLDKKGYSAFVQRADLGEKGTWHRVRIGPFAEADQARQVADRVQKEEKLSAYVAGR